MGAACKACDRHSGGVGKVWQLVNVRGEDQHYAVQRRVCLGERARNGAIWQIMRRRKGKNSCSSNAISELCDE